MRNGSIPRCFLSAARPWLDHSHHLKHLPRHRGISTNSGAAKGTLDPRLQDLGPLIKDDYATLRDSYQTPKYPIVLAHGLLGFDELRPAGGLLPGLQYWRGIKEVLNTNKINVITTAVPAAASIEARAAVLLEQIKTKVAGKPINVVAHSMGGLDARYLISSLKAKDLNIKSLTTIATPHRGSSFADYLFRELGDQNISRVYKLLSKLQMDSGAFSQLTTKYMEGTFNPANPDDPAVRYFSYGARFTPSLWSVFRFSHNVIEEIEGPNDGLVSVKSSKWDENGYKGTLDGVSHLELINWTNRLKWLAAELKLTKRAFNAIAFYLGVADALAKEGL